MSLSRLIWALAVDRLDRMRRLSISSQREEPDVGVRHPDGEASTLSLLDLYRFELTSTHSIEDGLAGDPERLGRCGQLLPTFWQLADNAHANVLVDAQPPSARLVLAACDEAFS
jgi:hypothetical protein